MLRKFSKSNSDENTQGSHRKVYRWRSILLFSAWLLVCFFVAELLVAGLDTALDYFNIAATINATLYNAYATAAVYVITIFLVLFVPRYVPKLAIYRIDKESLGIIKLPAWRDIILAPAGLVIYFILSSILILITSQLFSGFNIDQPQDVGFNNLNTNFQYFAAFVTLIVVVPFAEEILFRGYLYGKLRRVLPVWVAIIIVGLVFGGLHGAWNVAIDTFALNIILCYLRETTDGLWAPILLHMAKNGVAFYFLFINPVLLNTLGGS